MAFTLESAATVITLITMLSDCTFDEVLTAGMVYVKFFEYEGFNMEEIIAKVLSVMKTCQDSATALRELVDMVNIGLIRGNVRTDQLQKTSVEGKTRILLLKERYGITMKENRSSKVILGRSTLTFTRIVNCFPFIASCSIKSGSVKPPVNICPFFSHELPIACQHSGFGSLIPKTGKWGSIVFEAYLAFMISFGEKVNPNSTLSFHQKFNMQKQFTAAAWMSLGVYSNELRCKMFKKLDLDSEDNARIFLKVRNALFLKIGKPEITWESMSSEIVEKKISFIISAS